MAQKANRSNSAARRESGESDLVAVIELGSTSVRMLIAEISPQGQPRPLESLQRAVSLGKDTFRTGCVERETTEACVQALSAFRRMLNEYGIERPDQIQAVATSAVREASNRDAMLDRIFIATGLDVKAIDEAEVSRFTYLAVQPLLYSEPLLRKDDTLVVEVGGGSTEVLMIRHGKVGSAHVYRLGSYRLRKMLEGYRMPPARLAHVMKSHVDRDVAQIVTELAPVKSLCMLALGGDARLAASLLDTGWDRKGMVRIAVDEFAALTEEVLHLTSDDLVRRYHVPYAEAEILGPALLAYERMAQAFSLSHIYVGAVSLRDGVLSEMATRGSWTAKFQRQILNSALRLGRKYKFDRLHSQRVANLAGRMFDVLQDRHRLPPRNKLILQIAALLHDIGLFVSNRNHHKHTMYLIMNGDLFGLGSRDLLLTALVARYHRRAMPKPDHEGYSRLDRHDRVIVAKLASILRVADALERRRLPAPGEAGLELENDALVVTLDRTGDLTLEQHGLREKGEMFEQVYGMRVLLRRTGGAA